MTAKISVIVPIYNVAPYLRQCIESIQNQTYENLEIILVDDGSTDGCGAICDEYAAQDARIALLHQENKGRVCARKTGIRRATGAYVGFVDGDDFIDSAMYEQLFLRMEEHQVDFVDTPYLMEYEHRAHVQTMDYEGLYVKSNEDGGSSVIFGINRYLDGIKPQLTASLCTKLFRREFLARHYLTVPEDIKSCEDLTCILVCIAYAQRVFVFNRAMYHYRQTNPSSITSNRNEDHMMDYVRAYQYAKEHYEKLIDKKSHDAVYHAYNLHMKQLHQFFISGIMLSLPQALKKEIHRFRFPIEHYIDLRKIVLYGVGEVGKAYFCQFSNLAHLDMVALVDKNQSGNCVFGRVVESLGTLQHLHYDGIIVAVANEAVYKEIAAQLTTEYSVDCTKIIWEKPQYALTYIH